MPAKAIRGADDDTIDGDDYDSGGITIPRPGARISFFWCYSQRRLSASEFKGARGFSASGEWGGSEMMRGATARQHDSGLLESKSAARIAVFSPDDNNR